MMWLPRNPLAPVTYQCRSQVNLQPSNAVSVKTYEYQLSRHISRCGLSVEGEIDVTNVAFSRSLYTKSLTTQLESGCLHRAEVKHGINVENQLTKQDFSLSNCTCFILGDV